eukprot:192182-Amphidinium_carterae.1
MPGYLSGGSSKRELLQLRFRLVGEVPNLPKHNTRETAPNDPIPRVDSAQRPIDLTGQISGNGKRWKEITLE